MNKELLYLGALVMFTGFMLFEYCNNCDVLSALFIIFGTGFVLEGLFFEDSG